MKFHPELIESITYDELSVFRGHLIKKGFDLNMHDEDGYSLLHWAAQEGAVNICKWILSEAPKLLNSVDKDGQKPLRIAAGEGHEKVIEIFLDFGADTESENDYRNGSALEISLLYKHAKIAMQLILAGANYTKKNDEDKSAVDYAYRLGDEDIIKLMGASKNSIF